MFSLSINLYEEKGKGRRFLSLFGMYRKKRRKDGLVVVMVVGLVVVD